MITVLLPTDFSKNADNAIRYALRLSGKIDCRYVFFHGVLIPVAAPPEASMMMIDINKDAVQKQLEAYAGKMFASAKMKMPAGRVSCLVSQGFTVGEQMLDVVKKTDTDLIIMGARGTSKMRKVLFGSSTADVIASAKVPVIAVPESYDYVPLKKMLHASDLTNIRKELAFTLPLAKIFNATLEVAHIADETLKDEKLIAQAQSIIKRRSYKKLKLYVEATTFGQSVATDLKLLIARHHPDMLIMFRHKHNWLGRMFFTSRTENLIYETKVPLVAFNLPE